MKTNRWMTLLCTSLLVLAAGARADAAHRLGLGAHYWTTVDDVNIDNVDEDGVSWIASFQYWPTLLGVELAVESFEEWSEFETADITTDTVTLGAAARLAF